MVVKYSRREAFKRGASQLARGAGLAVLGVGTLGLTSCNPGRIIRLAVRMYRLVSFVIDIYNAVVWVTGYVSRRSRSESRLGARLSYSQCQKLKDGYTLCVCGRDDTQISGTLSREDCH